MNPTVLKPLTDAFDKLLDVVEAFVDPMALLGKLLERLPEILKPLTDIITSMEDLLGDLLDVVVKPLTALLTVVLTPVKAFLELLKAVLEPFKVMFDLMDRLVALPLKAFGKILELLMAPLHYLFEALNDLVKAIEVIVDTIGLSQKAMKNTVRAARDAMDTAWGEVVKAVKDPLSNLLPLMDRLRGFVSAIDPYIVEQFDLAIRDLTALFGSVLRPAFAEVTRLVREFASRLAPVMDKIQPMVDKLIGSIGSMLESLIPVFIEMLNDLIPLAQKYVAQLRDEIKMNAAKMKSWRALEDMIMGMFDPARAARKAAAERKGPAKKDVTGLASAVNPRSTGIQQYGAEVQQRAFAASFQGGGDPLKKKEEAFYDMMMEAVQGKINNGGLATQIVDRMVGGVIAIMDRREAAKRWGGPAAAAAGGAFGGIMDTPR